MSSSACPQCRSGLPKPSLYPHHGQPRPFAGATQNIERTAPVIPNRHTDLNNFRESDRIPEEENRPPASVSTPIPRNICPCGSYRRTTAPSGTFSIFRQSGIRRRERRERKRCGHRGNKRETFFIRFLLFFVQRLLFGRSRMTVVLAATLQNHRRRS